MSGRTIKEKYGKFLFTFLMLALVAGMGYAGSAYLRSANLTAGRPSTGPGALAPFASLPVNGGDNVSGSGPVSVGNGVQVGVSYKNDVSPALRNVKPAPVVLGPRRAENENPSMMTPHKDQPDTVVQRIMAPLAMPTPILNFDGIPFPGVSCNCAPPDTDGEVGATQYVQMVNEGFQVFNKSTGASLLGPLSISSVWSGFGGVCQSNGNGDPVVLYDQLANRWVISQFAGSSVPTDECIAVSTTSDATGTWNRYGFHLGTNFFDYPHLAVWPDAYYMADNVFDSTGSFRLGPQPFAFNRAAMLAGTAATFVTTGITVGANEPYYLPADLEGSTLPPAGAPDSFVEWPGGGTYKTFHFHADFVTPANTTFTQFAAPAAAGFTQLCSGTRACVPELAGESLDGIGDRFMFRASDRFFPGYESLVSNYTVSSGGVAAPRWVELRNVTSGPETVAQESTYQPDTTWRWMGSIAQDINGNMILGFSASSATINPQIRYAGRLSTDPVNTLAQGEAHLFDGTGSQVSTSNRWGDYSDMTVDPVDGCTFWYTQEYYQTTSSFNWRTRIGSFKFASCAAGTPTPTRTGTPPTSTPTASPTRTPTLTPTPCAVVLPVNEGFESGLGSFASVVATCVPGGCGWNAVTSDKHSGAQSAFAPDLANITDQSLQLSTGFAIPSGATSAVLSFWHRVALENTFDGGVLEFSTDNGATWSTSDPTFISGGYNGTISTLYGSPISGRNAWTGTIGGAGSFVQVQVDLSAYIGQSNLRFRFREGNDSSVAATGWWVDDVQVTLTITNCATSTPTSTNTPTRTFTPSNTPTRTFTPTNTPTTVLTNTPTRTNTPASTSTNTPTRTSTPVLAGTLIGHVTWQGITQPNAHNTGITATLSLCVGAVPQNYSVATDASGFFTVTLNLPAGSYNWGLKAPINLGNSGTVTLAAGTNNVEFGLMKAGDCNNNNIDNTQDFTLLKATFGKGSGDPGYDSRADFNRDAIVNTQDFTLLKNNFGQAGTALTCP